MSIRSRLHRLERLGRPAPGLTDADRLEGIQRLSADLTLSSVPAEGSVSNPDGCLITPRRPLRP